MSFHEGDKVMVYGKWKGTIKGAFTNTEYIVQYTKHNDEVIGIVEKSRLKKLKT